MLSRDLWEVVEEELRPGEKVLWQGGCASRVGRQENAAHPLLWPAVWLVIGLVLSVALANPLPILMCGLIAGGLGYYLTFHSTKMYWRSRTRYVVTDRRVMKVVDAFRHRYVSSLPFSSIKRVDLKLNTIQPYKGSITLWTTQQVLIAEPGRCLMFYMIEKPKRVVALVRERTGPDTRVLEVADVPLDRV